VHNSHRKQQNTHKNSETEVGNHSNPLPLWQACIYPALGTGDLQCSPGFLPPAAIHRAHSLGLCPQARTSPTHTSNTSQRISNFPLEERRNNRIAFCQNHCDLLMTESAATPRTHLTQAQKTKNNKQKKKKRTLQSRSCSAATIIQQPLQEEAHIMIPLVCLHGCIIHWMNSLFLIH